MDKLVLFDVDGTLIKGFESHGNSFCRALKQVFDIDIEISGLGDYHGLTDQQIITKVASENGVAEEVINKKLKGCLDIMEKSFEKLVERDNILVLGGVKELLEDMEKRGVLMGLVTGNIEPIARGKMRKVGLNQYFKLGGFGNEDIDRSKLVKMAVKKAEESFNFKGEVFLIGDTPKDLSAGKKAGVKVGGVATGTYSKEQLEEEGADFIFEDLEDTEEILKKIEEVGTIH